MHRIATHLQKFGVAVTVLVAQTPLEEALAQVTAFRPDILHAFHAFKAGIFAFSLSQAVAIPFVVTLTGTDVHEDLHHSERGQQVRQVLEAAAAITVFSEAIAEELTSLLPSVRAKVHIVPQGVWFPPQENWEVRSHLNIPTFVPVLLLPANIRRVKRPLLAVEGTAKLRERGFKAHLLLAGDILEREEGERVIAALRNASWAHYLGSVPMERMASVYRVADIVLNTSEHEGGMANALLEAMWLERPVLASRVPGNQSFLRDGETGLLFDTADELAYKAEQLLTDAKLRQRLVRCAKAWVQNHCDPTTEAQRYLQVYASIR